MNSIERDFLSEMDLIETDQLDAKLPGILADKVEGFVDWCLLNVFYECPRYRVSGGGEYEIFDDIGGLYSYYLTNIDGK